MTFKSAIRTCLRKYVTFSGRASRPEYWWFVLFVFLGGASAWIVDGLLFGFEVSGTGDTASVETNGPITGLFLLAMFLPLITAGWRRMHDSGRSGLYLFYPVIVIIGISSFFGAAHGFAPLLSGELPTGDNYMALLLGFSLIVLLLSPLIVIFWLSRPSQPGSNRYGPHPSEVSL